MQSTFLKTAAALIAATLVAGCATSGPSKQAASPPPVPPDRATTRAALVKGLRDSVTCAQPIREDRRYAPLRAKSSFFRGQQPAGRQLRDRSKPSAQHAQLLGEWRSRTRPCREVWLQNIAVMPNVLAVERDTYAKTDVVLNALERREIAWGEANTSLLKIRRDGDAARGRALDEVDRTPRR